MMADKAIERSPFSPRRPLKATQVSEAGLVRESPLRADSGPPLVLQPNDAAVDLVHWAGVHRAALMAKLIAHGALLFRGFSIDSPEAFADLARALTPDLLDYLERAAARSQVAPKVFTSTELAADQWIPHHHEMSYSHNWPARIYFYCDTAAAEGGCTPIASEREFFPRLDPAIKRRFIEHKVMYVRNYGHGLDLTWQDAFQTDDRAAVEDYCRRFNVAFEWTDGNRLRTRQVRQSIATHPQTGETVWFNHAHLFHQSNLEPEIREVLLQAFGSEGLPRNAYFGDGTPIETSMLDDIRALYHECAVSFPWQRGDVLLLDNFITVHAREPYKGARRILVAMADLHVSGAPSS
ncbi:TauD/TfdA family dioxygenase [Bradyrhizobium hipponense]|nr:TauD/TfdA family dioxygenase [Bradyrhizobium hipponense]